MTGRLHVAVVGAGIMGCCTALSLGLRGHRVTLIEQHGFGEPSGASADWHRLLRTAYGSMIGYSAMARHGLSAWNRLWETLGESFYIPTGAVVCGDPGSSWITASLKHAVSGEFRSLDRLELTRMIPGLEPLPDHGAWFFPSGGVLLANRILERLHSRLDSVADLRKDVVVDIDPAAPVVILAGSPAVSADRVVVCTGAWPWPGGPQRETRATRQTALYLKPAVERDWSRTPFLLDLSTPDGFYFVPPIADTPAKLGTHAFGPSTAPDQARSCSGAELHALEDILTRRASFLAEWERLGTRACVYDVAPDERFLAVARGPVHFLGGFSGHGFKFAPLVGERLVELLEGRLSAGAFAGWFAGH